MHARRIEALAITCVIVLAVAVSAWLWLSSQLRSIHRVLPAADIRITFSRFADWPLPQQASHLQAIYHNYRGFEQMFLAFGVSEEGWKAVVEAIGGECIRREEFPNEEVDPGRWDMYGFWKGCAYQEELGVTLFARGLLDQIRSDDIRRIVTGSHPKDAVAVSYLASPDNLPARWRVLFFKDECLVYIFAARETVHGAKSTRRQQERTRLLAQESS